MQAKVLVNQAAKAKALVLTSAFLSGQALYAGKVQLRSTQWAHSDADFHVQYVPSSSSDRSIRNETVDIANAKNVVENMDDSIAVFKRDDKPISRNEAYAVASTIGSDPEALNEILPGNTFTDAEKGSILQRGMDVVQRPELVRRMIHTCERLQGGNYQHETLPALLSSIVESEWESPIMDDTKPPLVAGKVTTSRNIVHSALPPRTPDEEAWHFLQQRHPCAYCQDVLAAPVILSECSHNFCGECLYNYTHNNGKTTVAADWIECPTCRVTSETDRAIYERNLDDSIVAQIQVLISTDSEVKADWAERRVEYFNLRDGKKKKILLEECGEEEEAREELEEIQAINFAVFCVAVAIMAGVAAMRGFH